MPPQPTPAQMRAQLVALSARLDPEGLRRLHAFVTWWVSRPQQEE